MDSAPPLPTPTLALPFLSHHSHWMLGFLNQHFKQHLDLPKLHSLALQLDAECSHLDRHIGDLLANLAIAASDWTARSNNVRVLLHHPDGNGRMGSENRISDVGLGLLAKEVARIETIRLYAETALKLEGLVGDLEDATFSIINKTSRNNLLDLTKASKSSDRQQAKILHAIKAMSQIEEVLVRISKSRAPWTHLLMAVDSRVEKALAILRPQVLSNHRILLVSLGWPPSLSNAEKNKCLEIPNPLVLMQGEKKEMYSQSFLELCALQHLHMRRTLRQHDLLQHQNRGYKLSETIDIEYGQLWPIDELVNPIASRMEYHFSQWSDEPKFIFVLVYKITRDFLDGVDNVLQPLIDKAALLGCSAREAWVSAMVKMLSGYLERQILPQLAMSYDGTDENMETVSFWLHLVDLMITWDKKMQALANSGTPITRSFAAIEGLTRSQSLFSVFDEHFEWLQIWAGNELKDAQQKLSLELGDERTWLICTNQHDRLNAEEEVVETFLPTAREDYKAPLIADSIVRISWAMMEKGRCILSKISRIQFIRSSAILFLNHFFIFLLQRSQDVDFVAAIEQDSDLLTAVGSINVARYCESVLQEWSEDMSFLEMMTINDEKHPPTSFFEDEIMFLAKLETDCLVEIVSALLLQFDALCLNYIQSLGQWASDQTESEGPDGNTNISLWFVEALDMIRDRLRFLKLNLNIKDFMDLWRSVAGGLDHFIFSSIPMGNVKFSQRGIDQFKADASALFLVFKQFCARPEAFFPCTNDSLKLLAMHRKDVECLLKVLSEGERRAEDYLRSKGIFHVSVGQAEKILSNRMFGERVATLHWNESNL